MSSPDVNKGTQERRHRPVKWLIVAATLIVTVGGIVLVTYLDEAKPEVPVESTTTTNDAEITSGTDSNN